MSTASDLVPAGRPFTLLEAFRQVLRRFYIVVLITALGGGVGFVLRERFRPNYISEASFSVKPPPKRPQLDSTIQLPQEDMPDPETISKNLMDDALQSDVLEALFKAQPKWFADDVKGGSDRFIAYIRKHTKIAAKNEQLYGVEAWGYDPDQARELASMVVHRAVKGYVRMQRERMQTLSKFTREQEATAKTALHAHEGKMEAFLRKNPALLVQALDRDRRLSATGPDRLRVQAMLNRASAGISSKDPALQALMNERARLSNELRSIKGQEGAAPTAGTAKLKELQSARQRLNDLKTTEGYGDDHPQVKQAARMVAQLESEVAALKPGEGTGTATYEAKLQARLKEIDAKLRGKVAQAKSSPRLEAEWGEMERELKLLDKRFQSYRKLAATAEFSNRLDAAEEKLLAAVVEDASTPSTPKGVKPWMLFVVSVFFAGIFGVGLALLVGLFDRKLYSADEVRSWVKLPLLAVLESQSKRAVARAMGTPPPNEALMGWSKKEEVLEVGIRLGTQMLGAPDPARALPAHQAPLPAGMIGDGAALSLIPASTALVPVQSMVIDDLLAEERSVPLSIRSVVTTPPLSSGLYLTTAPMSSGADQMRLLASRLIDAAQVPFRVIVVAGWERASGRTTVAANLGMALAEARKRTLLIDTCSGDGALTRLFALRPEEPTCIHEQLSARLAGGNPSWTLYRVADSLSVLPAGMRQEPMAPLLSSLAFSDLLEQFRSIFDAVVIDTVPLATASDAVVLQQRADTAIVVVRRKHTTLRGLGALVQQLDPSRLGGVVVNQH
jgi:Mrp family chromosome partitioning ATPase/uncharacterized protein involved in exopolysaccharide biosynthesis